MIQFFRKFRQQFLIEGNIGRYLKYAIGEILLVVLGILIALQINNWNENRKSDFEEQRALVNVKRDFVKNQELLIEVTRKTNEGISAGLEILNYTGNKARPESENDFNELLNDVFNGVPYYPQNGFLDDLLNSGNLSIFKDENLRNLLSSWKANLEILNERFLSLDKNWELWNFYMMENGSWLDADQVMKIKRSVQFPLSGFDVDNRDMLNDLKFENLTENFTISLDGYLTNLVETSALLEEILSLLDRGIES